MSITPRVPTAPRKPNRNKNKSLQKEWNFQLGTLKETPIVLSHYAKRHHTLFYGTPLEGRVLSFLSYVEEEAKQSDFGATFIIDSPQTADYIMTLAKTHKRSCIWLNPQLHLGVQEQLLFMESYDEDLLNEFILNYEKEIRLGHWVIIDLEPFLYQQYSIRAVHLLLHHLKKALITMKESTRFPHTLYVENPVPYLDALAFFIEHGKQHDLALMLWMDSPQQFILPHFNFLPSIEIHVRNVLVHSFHAVQDRPYFVQLFKQIKADHLENQPRHQTFYRILMTDTQMKEGVCRTLAFDETQFEKLKFCNKGRRSKLISLVYEKKAQREAKNEANEELEHNPHLSEEDRLHFQNIRLKFLKKSFVPPHPKAKPLKELAKESFIEPHLSNTWRKK